jgi:hypothetical protein
MARSTGSAAAPSPSGEEIEEGKPDRVAVTDFAAARLAGPSSPFPSQSLRLGQVALYVVVGLENGTILVFRLMQQYPVPQILHSVAVAGGQVSEALTEPAEAALLDGLPQASRASGIYSRFSWLRLCGTPPPLPSDGFVGPVYVRALPYYCVSKKYAAGDEVQCQFLACWLDGRLAHCHIGVRSGTGSEVAAPGGAVAPQAAPPLAPVSDHQQYMQQRKFHGYPFTWSTIRCLHTPDSLYRLDFFSEYLKSKEWNHTYGNASGQYQSTPASSMDADQFSHYDGKRYISCAASSWSGHTYIVHVLIHDPSCKDSAIAVGQPPAVTESSSTGQPADAAATGVSSGNSIIHKHTQTRQDEVIYCFDSRLLFAGGASRIFCCASYRGTPSLIYINADNSIRVAADLRRQLKKFKEPKLALEFVAGNQGYESD